MNRASSKYSEVTHYGNGGVTSSGAGTLKSYVWYDNKTYDYTWYCARAGLFIRDGYVQTSWRDTPNQESYSKYYICGKTYTYYGLLPENPYKLYAVWTPGIRITWKLDGGTLLGNAATTILTNTSVQMPGASKPGYQLIGWAQLGSDADWLAQGQQSASLTEDTTFQAIWEPMDFKLTLDPLVDDGIERPVITVKYGAFLPDVSMFAPTRPSLVFAGWFTEPEGGTCVYDEDSRPVVDSWAFIEDTILYAHWTAAPLYSLSYLLNEEPQDDVMVGEWPEGVTPPARLDQTQGRVHLPSPVRPGYAFMGWMPEGLPNDDALLAKGPDGIWSLETAKLPDYAGADNLVTLVARWSSVLSVDVPSLATFLYDLSRFDPDEPRTAYAEGGARFLNRSAADLRVSGLESRRGEAADALSLADPSPGGTKVLAAFPDEEGTSASLDAAKGPAGALPAHAVSFSLDDVLLEAAFDPMAWKVPASGMLEVGYRLNLGEGASLDPSALLASGALPDGANHGPGVTIATITYCFALA